ncbi:hypothetical protein ACFXHA_27570 [Nocardia sp. NPDC059240]|uniref:hypothetical protein n=1 Tax=Nocardia sp. NPDC059240 TaxID=3346786 RepID=UPI0036D1FC9B
MAVYDTMRELFERNDLGVPPIPPALRPELRQFGRWAFGTRTVEPFEMYMFHGYIQEAQRAWVPDYVAVSHAGHGINSYAITYQLCAGPLVVIAQSGWGGVYSDPVESAAMLRRMFAGIATLVGDLAVAHVDAGHRWLIVHSEFRGGGFAECRSYPESGEPRRESRVRLSEDVGTALAAGAQLLRGNR